MIEKLNRRYTRHCKMTPFKTHLWVLIVGGNLVLLAFLLLDQPVAAYIRSSDSVMKAIGVVITDFGKSNWILFASVILLMEALTAWRLSGSCAARFRALQVGQLAAYLLATVAVSGIVANIAKRLIGRVRPLYQDDWSGLGFSPLHGSFQFESFPSGHATTVGAIMMAVALIVPRARMLCLVLAMWLGVSRVLVSAHYLSDVVAGLTLGAWFSILFATLFARFGVLFRETPHGLPILRHSNGVVFSSRMSGGRPLGHTRSEDPAAVVAAAA